MGKFEHNFRNTCGDLQNRFALFAHCSRRYAKETGEYDNLQHVAARRRIYRISRNNFNQHVHHVDGFLSSSCCRRRIARNDLHAYAGFKDVNYQQTYKQSHRGCQFKPQNGFRAQTTQFFEVACARNAHDQGTEDQRHHDHLNHTNKDVANRFELFTIGRKEIAKNDA